MVEVTLITYRRQPESNGESPVCRAFERQLFADAVIPRQVGNQGQKDVPAAS
jgi:hypothetical protein